MKGSQRQRQLKRSLAKANHDLDRALANIQDVHEAFDNVHPEYIDALEAMAIGLVVVQESLKAFWASAWGGIPETLDGYRL